MRFLPFNLLLRPLTILLLWFPMLITRVGAQRPTNGPQLHPREETPDRFRGSQIPTTAPPTPEIDVVPSVSPVITTHAPNPPRAQPYPSKNHRGPTDSPTSAPAPPGPCFSGHSSVQVEGKGTVYMKDLTIGDKVEDANGKFVAVYSFGHYKQNYEVEYLLIYIQGLNKPLEVSSLHLVFRDGKAVPASTIVVGDEIDLRLAKAAPESVGTTKNRGAVYRIENATRTGMFAPLTTSGTIVVDQVVASSYVAFTLDTGEWYLLDKYPTGISQHWMLQLYQTPHRLFCSPWIMGAANCGKWETYNDYGLSSWAEVPIATRASIVDKNSSLTTKVRSVGYLAFWFTLAIVLYTVEVGWMYLLMVLLLASVGMRLFKRVHRKTASS